jgi:hypothetical protein
MRVPGRRERLDRAHPALSIRQYQLFGVARSGVNRPNDNDNLALMRGSMSCSRHGRSWACGVGADERPKETGAGE